MKRCRSLPGLALVCCLLLPSSPAPADERRGPVHDLAIEVGVGYDSNPFLAPSRPYFDQNQQAIVVPREEPGFLVPARITGALDLPLGEGRRSFLTDYRLHGSFYPESAASNAEEALAKVESGLRFRLGGQDRDDRTLDVRGFAGYRKDVYFDRDTGLDATSEGVSVSDRFTHTAIGGEVALDYELTRRVDLIVEALGERRNYEDPGIVESFDHDRLRGTAGVTLRLARTARLQLKQTYEVRDYSDRISRSLDGDKDPQNPLLEYTYADLTASLRLRPADAWSLDLRFGHKERSDGHLRYNDYVQRTYRVRSTLNAGRWRWVADAKIWDRAFDRAFIFDDDLHPVSGQPNPRKDYQTVEVDLDAHVTWKRHLSPFVRVEHVDQSAEDPRFDYRRTQGIVGLRWHY